MGRRRWVKLDDQVRRQVLRFAAEGLTYEQIKGRIDISDGTIANVLRPHGGVIRPELWHPSRFRLSLDERVEIYVGLGLGRSLTEIAVGLGRSTSTVSREVANNGGRDRYRPFVAHRRACRLARRPKERKLACPRLRDRVVADLNTLWSPWQIARRLRADYPDDPEMWVSHETIYKTLYIQGRGELRRELTRCLRTGRATRRPQGRAVQGARISKMVMISERPAEVADRAIPGHWEGDLIMGKDNKSAVATLVERSTRYVLLAKIKNHKAETVRDALLERVETLPHHLWRSLTWDQGTEMAKHMEFTQLTGIQVYFCDPHSPWQRGSNENTNGLLRQYMPKGISLRGFTQDDLDAIAVSLNGRPRETLNFQTPAERLAELLR
ncbi:MAG TPA: IS30 family transposase [Acidimicrobiia bacterium]|nr:IS30 family transposase [Acidimicrobiia bacterium]